MSWRPHIAYQSLRVFFLPPFLTSSLSLPECLLGAPKTPKSPMRLLAPRLANVTVHPPKTHDGIEQLFASGTRVG